MTWDEWDNFVVAQWTDEDKAYIALILLNESN